MITQIYRTIQYIMLKKDQNRKQLSAYKGHILKYFITCVKSGEADMFEI